MPPVTPSLSQRAMAKRTGVPRVTLQRWVEAGKVPKNHDGTIPLAEGLAAIEILRGARGETAPAAPSPETAPEMPARVQAAQQLATDIRTAELAKKQADARLADLRYQRERGEVVAIEEVQADARAACEEIRTRLLSLGPRVALVIESLCARPGGPPRAAAVQSLIDDEINAVLTALHATKFGRGMIQ